MKERQYRLSLVWFLLLVIVSQATFAQITEWIPVTSPFGDSVAQLWQISDGDLFAAIGNPGTSLIYRSTDDGFTWQFESISIPVDAVSANGTFFAAGSYLGEPFHSSIEHFSLMSTDFGRTWSIPLIITPENVGFAFVPTNGARVFAMGGQTLFASDSEGIDWFEISVGPDIPPPHAWLRLATGKEGVVIAITDDAFMVSTNDGDSWDKRVQQFGEHPVSDLVILNENRFAGLRSGALQYTGDGGLHWVSRPLPAERGIVSGLTVFGIQNLFLGTNKGGFVSDNRGQSWQQIEHEELVFQTMLSTLSGDVLAGTSEGVYRQSASGSWISSTFGIPKLTGTVSVLSDGDLFILSESGEMYRSSDRGISWLPYGAPENARVVGLAEGVNGTLYLASRREPGVYMWTNGGDSWVPLGLDGISALTVMESGTILGVVGNDNRFFSSSDGGTNWEIVSQLDLGSSIRHLRSTGMGIVYAASYRGLHRSDDEGRTWVHVLNEPTRELHVASEGAIWFVSTNGDLFQSTDEGETWAEVNGPFDVFSLGVTNGNSLFASSEMGELWRSNNLGESWYHFEQIGLPEPAQALEGVTAPFSGFGFPEITLKIGRDGYLYAMLYGLFYRSDSAIATSIERPAVELPSASFMDIYPNPTRDVAHLSFRLNQAGPVRLSVFDTIGREVVVLDDGYKSQGTYEFSLRQAGLSTGIYFVRLKASDSNQTKKLVLLR